MSVPGKPEEVVSGPIPPATPRIFFRVFPSVMLPMFLAMSDQTIVASALPTIAGALGDVERKEAYDVGADIKRDILNDGSEGPSFWDRMRQEYFPEQFGYEPFGDPYEHKVSPHPNP